LEDTSTYGSALVSDTEEIYYLSSSTFIPFALASSFYSSFFAIKA